MKTLKKLLVSVLIAFSMFMLSPVVFDNLPISSSVEAATIKISKSKYTMKAGTTYKLKITGTSKKVKWSSSNKSIATVNSSGKVTAKKKGTVTISAKVGNKTYKCKITVTAPKSTTVYITRTGSKYHRSSCSYLRKSKIKTTLSSAKARGYTPCSRCRP